MASRFKQIPESLLARLWKDRAARQASFKAGDGTRLRVIYPGRVGTGAGPDFRDAVFEFEGVGLIRGDVEVHVRQKDWDAHGHGNDPRYNGVVLHVVCEGDGSSTTLRSGQRAPVVSLESLLRGPPSPGPRPGLWSLLSTHGHVPPESPAELGELLDRAGDARFLEASQAFSDLLKEEEAEQVLYESLMEALGYSQNGEPFLELARRVPYRLLSEAVLKLSGGERRYEIQANLLWAAGFQMPLGSSGHHSHSPVQAHRSGSADEDGRRTPRNRPDVLADTGGLHIPGTSKAAGLWGSHRVKPMGLTRWHTFRVRPQNHPRRRIVGFAHVLDLFLPSSDEAPEPWAQKGLMNGMACLLERSSDGPGIVRGLEAGLMGMAQARSRVASYYGSRQEGLIGRGRARDMAVNCVLPFFHALADFRGDETLERLCLRVYRGLPRLQENEITREMWGQLSYPLVGTGGGEAREAYVELASGWERLPQAVDDGGSPAEPSGRVEGLRKEVVCNARRQQGLLHLHNLIASPGKAPLWRSA